MKKLSIIFCAVCVISLITIIFLPKKLPTSVQKMRADVSIFIKNKQKLFFNKTTETTPIYTTQEKGTTVFTDRNKKDAKIHTNSNTSNFIDMYPEQQDSSREKNSSFNAVIDPINSINEEAKKNVDTMRTERNKQLEEKIGL